MSDNANANALTPEQVTADRQVIRAFEAWLKGQRTANTARAYMGTLMQVGTWVHARDETLCDASSSLLASYIDYRRKEGRAPATLARDTAALRTFFSWHCGDRDRVAALDPERHAQVAPRLLTVEDAEHVVQYGFLRAETAERDAALLALLFYCAAKACEVSTLVAEDLDVEGSGVWLGGASGRRRYVPVSPQALPALLPVFVGRAPEELVFPNRLGEPLSTRSIHRIVRALGESQDVDGVSPERLRDAGLVRWEALEHSRGSIQRWGGYTVLASASRRLGSQTADIEACARCSSPGDKTCTLCFGSGIRVRVLPKFTKKLTRRNALRRLRSIVTELPKLGRSSRRLRIGPVTAPQRTAEAAAVVAGVVKALEGQGEPDVAPPSPKQSGKDAKATQQRLHACATDLRKLAQAMKERRWISAVVASGLERAGADVELLSWEVSGGERPQE